MLIHLMENYIRTEHQMMERDNTLNEMMSDLSERNKKVIKVEVFSMKHKPTINQLYDRYMRKGHFSVMFIEGGD